MKLQTLHPQESMLQDTILVLKQRQGASLAQIRKRLELKEPDGKIDEAKDKMLTSTLKGLVQKGTIEKSSDGIYKLARGVPADGENDVPSRRRRAFPRGVSKTHRRYRKLRRRKGLRHKRRRKGLLRKPRRKGLLRKPRRKGLLRKRRRKGLLHKRRRSRRRRHSRRRQ